ncbi:sushi, von Willebrand factor type A, EGF and pentraxin domain-containing protein 1-like isoform X1 [Oculina patagonica]
MTPKMWKTYLVVAIFIFIFPFIESKRKKSDSINDCRRTNEEAFRYCTKSCRSDSDCRSNQKCLCDGDCGISCVRNNVQCEAPPKAKNSRQTVSNGRSFNSVVTYTCNSPYKLRGSAKRTCRANGKWDGKKARCKIMCKDPGEITYGNRQVDGMQAGKYIKYWCIGDAYKLVGSAILKCLDTGEWDNPPPKCELPKCDPPKIPDSATVYWPRRMPKKFKFSDRVLLKCKEGYFKSKGGFLKCNGPDNWSGDITCSPKSCGSPGDIPHGRVIGYVYSFKERVEYVCDEGYKLKGPAYRICQANEEWGGSQPVCEVVNCGPLNKPDHGDIIEQVALTFDNRIVFECNEKGYEMKGSRVRTCQSNGNWSGAPTTCELVQCGVPGQLANGQQKVSKGFVYGGSVTFTCDRDYTLKGTSTMYCQENKQWTASVPQCLAPCPDPGQPHQGNRIGDDFRHDKTVTFTCLRNYVMEGVRTIKCTNGQWSTSKPSCMAPCNKLAPPVHGRRSGDGVRHRSYVRFFCSYGYTRIGAPSVTCNDGKWNKPAPVCKGICLQLITPSNGRLQGYKARYLEGDEVTFSCNNGFDLFGDAKLRCVGSRKWNSREPVCKARCRFSGRPAHGYYNTGSWNRGDMIRHGVKITYGCLATYTMVGANVQECDNGGWTNAVPMCKASCRPPANIAHGRKIGSDFSHGKTIRFECDARYTLDGNTRLTCNDGAWDSNPPRCRAPCSNPGAPLNGNIQGGDFKHNSWVTFVCNPNYQLDGKKQIQCKDGTWSGSVPNCIAVCPDPGIPDNGNRLDDNFQDGKTVTFRCNRNYDLKGNDTIWCKGGVWSSDAPECRGRCTFDGNPDNGYTPTRFFRRDESLPHGSNVEYACDVSYTLVGSNVRHCVNGSWNTSLPSCKASCDDPGLIVNGHKTGSDFSHGQVLTYKCTVQGYSLVGNPRLICNDGSWDSDPPECKASCNALPAISDGTVHNNGTSHGALVSFSCKKGFQLKGSQRIMCLDGKWNETSPTCKGTCKGPRPLDNGRIIGDDYSYGSSINFVCNFGYDLRGPASLTCTKGVWNGKMPECKKRCKDPGHPLNGRRSGANYTHGGVVQFKCKDRSFDLIGASRITCDEGEWSHLRPSCEARCSNPGIPDNGTKEGNDYRSRANVTFKCNPPLELIGSRVIFCQDGKWSAAKPTCSSCGRPLGLENNTDQAIRITSPASAINSVYGPSAARLNGPFAWCPSQKIYLQIDLGKDYKLTAIATQGGEGRKTWVKMYRISFMAGDTIITYSESGSPKIIEANKDASSVVKHKFKEPFVTKTVRIHPLTVSGESICLRTELYGCDPTPDCVLVGSMFWGMWAFNKDAFNYYRAYITKMSDTHVDFALKFDKRLTRSYKRTEPVLIIDKVPSMEDITVNSPVIAEHRTDQPRWYRSGTVKGTSGSAFVSVEFDDGKLTKWVRLENLRLVKRPRFCVDNI